MNVPRHFAFASVLLVMGYASTAVAQSQRNVPLAEALFQEARKLQADGKIHEACEKYAESQKLDPTVGALLNLARCHEMDHRTASAWSEYTQVVTLSERAGQADRTAFAKNKVAELSEKVGKLRLVVDPRLALQSVTLDEQVLGRAAVDVALPLDAGEHRLTFLYEGSRTASRVVTIADGSTVPFTVPEPDELPPQTPPPPVAPPVEAPRALPVDDTSPSRASLADAPKSARRTWGYVVGGVGLATLGAGGVLGVLALGKKSTVDDNCQGAACKQAGVDAASAGRGLATGATIAFIAGGALAGAGALLIFIPPKSAPSVTATWSLRITPALSGASLGGVF